ncbi:putative amidophosphoribosyltransferase, glutamine amidotransferase type 2 domain-containing protein [Plasmopara halstedii]
MCGIIALMLANKYEHCNQGLYDGLTVLQHRGQDAAGIMTCEKKRLFLRKDNGLVRDVFKQNHMLNLRGNMGIGHCRYPTAGSSASSEAQPFYTNSPYGVALAHNGNLTNSHELVDQLANTNFRHVNTDSDSELLLNILASELLKRVDQPLDTTMVLDAVTGVFQRCRGGFAAVVLINGFGIVAFRDPLGFVLYVAIATLEFKLERDFAPGEAMVIKQSGEMTTRRCVADASLSSCIFEHVYFARPDSFIDGVSVYQARRNMGAKLAQKILRERPNHGIDVIIPIPDTSRTSALEASQSLNIPYREGFVKNRYIARTFIMPGQVARKKTVRMKLNAIRSEFEGKVVLLVDDSIVRGTTSRQIVQIARENGAKAVYFASAAPAIRYPNVYGIDMPTTEELIAFNRTEAQVAKEIGCEWMIFQDLKDLEDSVRQENTSLISFDSSCFDGKYVTGDVDQAYFERLHAERCDARMEAKNMGFTPFNRTISMPQSDESIDMYNAPQ